jgi:hypothetical protein
MVTIDDASRSSSDAMPDRADAPELLDVEVDQFAWIVALIAPNRLCRLEGREELCRKIGDGVNQAADLISATASIPSLNFIPLTTFGNWF